MVKILVLPAQVQHALFMRTESVQRFPVGPFEFQLGMVGLTINHLLESAGACFKSIRSQFGLDIGFLAGNGLDHIYRHERLAAPGRLAG
ncbi:MAG: hypothetical protein WCE68_16260 [Anaerolineales bacterium]